MIDISKCLLHGKWNPTSLFQFNVLDYELNNLPHTHSHTHTHTHTHTHSHTHTHTHSHTHTHTHTHTYTHTHTTCDTHGCDTIICYMCQDSISRASWQKGVSTCPYNRRYFI
jgi:hypothetical protein